MDIGTPVVHTDDDENTFAGQIVGRDHEMRPVVRSKAPKGQVGDVVFNADGTLKDKPDSKKGETVSEERVETGLFNVEATYRDGHKRLLTLAPDQLREPDFSGRVPRFSHDPPVAEAPAAAPAAEPAK